MNAAAALRARRVASHASTKNRLAKLEDPVCGARGDQAALRVGRDSRGRLAAAIDLVGHRVRKTSSRASALWLPLLEASSAGLVVRRTVKAIPTDSDVLVAASPKLLGPDSTRVLEWLRRAALHDGLAAEFVDEGGLAISNGGDAALSGYWLYGGQAVTCSACPHSNPS